MKKSYYKCDAEKLHIELKPVFKEKKIDAETIEFIEGTTFLYGIKFILFIMLSALKLNHYYIMGLL